MEKSRDIVLCRHASHELGRDRLDSCVRPTDAAAHIRSSRRSEESGHEAAAVGMTGDLHLLAGLANGFHGLLGVHGADVDIAVCQRRRRRAGGVDHHDIVGSMGRACADAGRSAPGTGSHAG